jgi:hypothetical protein
MKKLLLILFAFLPMMMQAQRISRPVTIRSTEFGTQKMEVVDSVFVLVIKTTYKPISVVLGKKEQALKILRFLYTADVRSGDIIEIENEAGDICKYNGLKQYVFFSAGKQFWGQIAKRYLKGYIEVIEKYGTENEKRHVPAFARNRED